MIIKNESVRTSDVSLFGPSQITLRDEDVTHRQHSKATKFLRCVEDDRWKTGWHLTVQADLDTGLDLVLCFHKGIQELVCVNDSLTVVSHQTDQSSVPLVDDLMEPELMRT